MFKVIWEPEYNGVRLTMSSKGDAINVSPRPVFWEELDLLGLNKTGWIYPHVEEPLLWACDRRYFYKGQFVLEVKGGNIFDAPTVVVQEGFEALLLKPVDMEKLRERNEDTMFIIEHEAMDFINQTYRRYKNLSEVSQKNPDLDFQQLASNLEKKTKEEYVVIKEDCDSFDVMPLSKAEEMGKAPILHNKIEMYIASFSGGKDSQVVLDLVTRVIPSEDLTVIYSDTGYELPPSLELFRHTKEIYQEKYPNLNFYVAKNHQPVIQYWDEMDAPSKIHRWCCAVMKTAPLYRLLKELHGTGKQPTVMAFEGVRAEESERRSQYARIGKGVKHNNVLNVRPVFEWSVTEIWMYLFFKNLPINEAYRKGLNRVGCVICPLSSELGDCLDYKLFRESAQPFVDKLISNTKRAGIKNVEEYIKLRKWKVRAGGDRHITTTKIHYLSQQPDFVVNVNNPKENILEWLKVMGQLSYTTTGNTTRADVKSLGKVYPITIEIDDVNNSFTLTANNIGTDVLFLSLLKRVVNKAAYCVHCEVCEVECPTGALTVVPIVKVNESKCVKCHKCLQFIDNGCEVANSIKTTQGLNSKNMNEKQSINRYNTFGLREHWLKYYMENHESYFTENSHGLNIQKQLPMFKKWLTDAGIIDSSQKITDIGNILSQNYMNKKNEVWEIIWVNLCDSSALCAWFIENFNFGMTYPKEEIEASLSESFPQYTETVRGNSLKAFQNTLNESPLGSNVSVGVVSKIGNKVFYTRYPYNNLSLVAVAYSLFKYAERQKRYSLTVSELFADDQKEGIYRQFGLNRDTFERLLLSIQEESNHVLRAELNMGLDNILLREDLNSTDIIKMML